MIIKLNCYPFLRDYRNENTKEGAWGYRWALDISASRSEVIRHMKTARVQAHDPNYVSFSPKMSLLMIQEGTSIGARGVQPFVIPLTYRGVPSTALLVWLNRAPGIGPETTSELPGAHQETQAPGWGRQVGPTFPYLRGQWWGCEFYWITVPGGAGAKLHLRLGLHINQQLFIKFSSQSRCVSIFSLFMTVSICMSHVPCL